MKKSTIIKILSFFVMFSGIAVAIGWIFDIGILKSISPNLVTMKFSTALCFIASGIVLYSVAEEKKESSFVVQAILPSAILLILLLMVTLFISAVFGFNTGLDDIFIQEKAGAISTFIPGRPSIPTMFDFILIAVSGILTLVGFKKHLLWLGTAVVLVGSVATLGYILNQPLLYYSIAGLNTAMALHTAILFILIGIGFILCGKTALKQN